MLDALATVAVSGLLSGGVAYVIARHQARLTAEQARNAILLELSRTTDEQVRRRMAAQFSSACLVISGGEAVNRERIFIPNGGRVTVGRDPSCDVVLESLAISRNACSFSSVGDGVVVQDLDSMNGVCLNGHRVVRSAQVDHGDVITVGPVMITVLLLARDVI